MYALTILTDGNGRFSINTTGLGRDQSPGEIVALLQGVIGVLTPVTLPEGWAPTLDGVSVHVVDGVAAHTRGYVLTHGGPDGPEVDRRQAPCGPSGETLEATVAALLSHVHPATIEEANA
jgi:hypothetical protein